MKLFLLLLCAQHIFAQDIDNVICTAKFCIDYVSEVGCPNLPDECTIQNSTHNGVLLSSPIPCNCCPYCLTNIGEGKPCAIGEAGGLVPDSLCGPGLECDSTTQKCIQMTSSACIKAQINYDTRRQDGTLGSLEVRPICTGDGDYVSYRCIPGQNCYCVDRDGDRIFGEVPFTSTPAYSLTCACSRKYNEAVTFIGRELGPHEHFRCVDNGDYDTIQCIGDACLCVDASDGAPTYPLEGSVHYTDISNETLPCFDAKIHTEGNFYYQCALDYKTIVDEVESLQEEGEFDEVFNYVLPNCDIDGKYVAVQKDSENAYCVTSDGDQIDSYSVGLDSADAKNINCKCARTNLLIPENNPEKPSCCANGNFNPMQCRRGVCYCVDENGAQVTVGNLVETPYENRENLGCKDCTLTADS